MKSSLPGLFIGGDMAGVSETTVESVNDGKTAAWFIHEYIQVSYGNNSNIKKRLIGKFEKPSV